MPASSGPAQLSIQIGQYQTACRMKREKGRRTRPHHAQPQARRILPGAIGAGIAEEGNIVRRDAETIGTAGVSFGGGDVGEAAHAVTAGVACGLFAAGIGGAVGEVAC